MTGCGSDATDEAGAGGAYPVVQATPGADLSSLAPDAPLPGEGKVIVQVEGDRVTVLANRAPRLVVLQALETRLRFLLEIARGAPVEAPVTVRAVAAPPDEALAKVLEGIPYSLAFGANSLTGERVLERVAVGRVERDGVAKVARRGSLPPKRLREGPEDDDGPTVDEMEKEERRQRLDEQLWAQLDDPDPTLRADAAEWIRPRPHVIPALADILVSDPSPTVRAAAATSLGDADESPDAVSALLRALDDPEPDVVMAALDGLEAVADATVVPDLAPLVDHRNPEIRERAVEAIELLEWIEPGD